MSAQEDIVETDTPEFWSALAAELDTSFDALEFLYDALGFTPQYHGAEADSFLHSSGGQLCKTLLRYGRDLYGDDLEDQFREWGLPKSEDWGRIVFELVNRGLLEAEESDGPMDFANLFDLNELQN